MADRNLVFRVLLQAKDDATRVFTGMQAKVAGVAAAIAGYFGINFFAGAVRDAKEFEAKMDTVGAVSGATAEEMARLKAAAEEMGATTRYTASEAADALEALARSGLSASESIAALPSVLALAQGNGIELAQSAELVTKTIAGMGLAVEDSARVADVLTKAAASANTHVLGLGQALSYAAPLAKSLGIPLEEVVSIIGKFADAGIDASRAGTALNSILAQFSDPASKFRQELGAAGIITTDFNLALHQLATAGPAGQRAILAVGQEAGPALRALLNQGVGALDDLTGKLRNAGGAAQDAAARMNDNLDGALRGLGSAWDAFRLKLADPVLGVLQEQVGALAGRIQTFVASGAATRMGEAIAAAFKAGGQWLDAFLAKADFGALSTRMTAFAESASQTFDRIGGYATTAGGVVQTAWGVMSTGANTVMALIYKIAEVFAGVASNVASGLAVIAAGISKVTFGGLSESFAAAAEEIRTRAGGLGAVAEEFAKRSSDAFSAAADGAQVAADGWKAVTDQVNDAAPAFERVEPAVRAVADAAAEASASVSKLGDVARESAEKQQKAADETAAKIAELRAEYDRLLDAGDTQGAARALQEINRLLEVTATQARTTGQDVENAFDRLGIKSQASLQQLTDAAKRDYDIIRNSGTATTADLKAAFRAYADKAIAANGGVATEALRVQAAINGISIEADAAGNVIVKAMNSAADATSHAADQTERLRQLQQRLSGGGRGGVQSPLSVQNLSPGELQNLLNPPGGGGGVGNLPAGLTEEQLAGLALTQAELDSYRLNSNLSADERAAGIVKRTVRTQDTNARQQAIIQGLVGAQIDRFVEVYGDYQLQAQQEAIRNLARGPVSADFAQQELARFSQGALAAAVQEARKVGGTRIGGRIADAQPQAVASTSHTVNINLNGRRTTINTASDSDATALAQLLAQLETDAGRA